jgi:hypothetical protein
MNVDSSIPVKQVSMHDVRTHDANAKVQRFLILYYCSVS